MSSVGIPRIYADFNGWGVSPRDPKKRAVYLNGLGSLAGLGEAGVVLTVGMPLTIFTDSTAHSDLEAEAIAWFDPQLNVWFAEIDETLLREVPLTSDFSKALNCIVCRAILPSELAFKLDRESVCPQCGTLVWAPMLPPDEH